MVNLQSLLNKYKANIVTAICKVFGNELELEEEFCGHAWDHSRCRLVYASMLGERGVKSSGSPEPSLCERQSLKLEASIGRD
jgi:hypothetical protein